VKVASAITIIQKETNHLNHLRAFKLAILTLYLIESTPSALNCWA